MARRWQTPCVWLLLVGLAGGAGCATAQEPAGPATVVSPKAREPVEALPNRDGSLKFAVLGDFGVASTRQYQLASQMNTLHGTFPFESVLLVGDNLYGADRPQDYEKKFEIPYKPLLDAKVKFYASLGNHDDRNQRYYKPFNMEGELHYTIKASKQNVKFFVFESSYSSDDQIQWLETELKGSNEAWKIAYFHHPLYSSGGRHGSDLALRKSLEPLLVKYNVSVVFTGHDHFYERIKPQQGIVYFVAGSGGQLAPGDIDPRSPLTAKGYDADCVFLALEIIGDQMFFNAVSRTGQVVDSGIIVRRQAEVKRP